MRNDEQHDSLGGAGTGDGRAEPAGLPLYRRQAALARLQVCKENPAAKGDYLLLIIIIKVINLVINISLLHL